MVTYFKATRPNGTDFYSGTIDYAAALASGAPVKHPTPRRGTANAGSYLSVSVGAGDCTGFSWPARLFEVKPVGAAWAPHKADLPRKRAAVAVTVIRELPAHMLFGPQGEVIVSMLDEFAKMSSAKRTAMYNARGTNWWDAYYRVAGRGGLAGRVGLGAARYALGGRLRGWGDGDAAYGAALAVLLRHTIGKKVGLTQAEYEVLTAPWVSVTGHVAHPEDVLF